MPPTKAQVPHPLPRTRGIISLPPTLQRNVTNALTAQPGSIARVQGALTEALERSGWNQEMEGYVRGRIESGADAGVEVETEEVLGAVVEMVMAGLAGEGRGGKAGELSVSGEAVEEMVRAVKAELEKCCTIVNEDAWEG